MITLDTGALIALERRKERILRVLRGAAQTATQVVVPSVALAEWWRARPSARMRAYLDAMTIQSVDAALASVAGEAVAAVPTATLIDAIVMASAARGGGVVYTSDPDDLMALQAHFRLVRVFAV
ncbi:MAG: hypothetical protein KIT84_29540 [Labilithrix sp.]|nr:hypothetical protein [Labilithrix sp.]MCW5815207.1 hypothetical protein [Labilithrix sp.]